MSNTEKKWWGTVRLGFGVVSLVLLFATTGAKAQQTTGQVGSPDATTTVDSRYLPSPPQKFTGEIDPPVLTPDDIKKLEAAARSATD